MKRLVCFVLLVFLLALPILSVPAAADDTVTLYVYNWGEYISDGSEDSYDSNAEFETWYYETYGQRVKVNYSTYNSNEDMYAKISAGGTKYDIVVPSDYMIARMIKEGLLRKLNKANIPNLAYIDLSAVFGDQAPYYDPTEEYSVPYTYGTVGIIYNREKVEEKDLTGWDLMWNEKYKGDILQFNNSRDAFATAMFKLGYNVNTTNNDQWYEALEELKKQKSVVQGYVMDEIYNKMETGSAAIAPYYAGDFFTMYEENENLDFFYPEEGTNVFVDAMCILKNSQNPDLAEAYINFMLSEEAAIANAEAICYASPNKLVYENEDYRSDMTEIHEDAMEILYGTTSIPMQFYEDLPEEQLALINKLWEELKIKSSVNVAIIVVASIIAVVVAGVVIFFLVRRSRRKKRLMNL